MPEITFMNNPNYVKDRNDILKNSEHALQVLEKKQLLNTSKLANNAESLGQGNTMEDIAIQEEQFYNNDVDELESNFQESLEKLYHSYLSAYANAYGGNSSSLLSKLGSSVLKTHVRNKMWKTYTDSLFEHLPYY